MVADISGEWRLMTGITTYSGDCTQHPSSWSSSAITSPISNREVGSKA